MCLFFVIPNHTKNEQKKQVSNHKRARDYAQIRSRECACVTVCLEAATYAILSNVHKKYIYEE
jgi:hypothetical protein